MAIHYMGDIKHMTCQTEKGFRRSPLSDISYNCGEKLTDKFTGRTHNRQHYDGTQIIKSDIVSADELCIYGNSSISSAERRNMMYNDLYRLNKKDSERIYWKTEIALSNEFTDEQLKEVSHEIAISFSRYLHRPIDYSIHKKPPTKTKPGNNHLHIASPERIYENGVWGSKSTSYYIDKDGNPIFDRNYKDANGNDIRKPCTIDNKKPIEAINPETGLKYYVNQRRDKKGRLQWKDRDINALTKADLKWMHNEIDRIQNLVLTRHKINDKVKRNDSRTTNDLKEAGIKAQHIGKRDMEKQGESYQEKMMLNRRYEFFKNTFDSKYAELDIAEKTYAAAELAEAQTEENCNAIAAEKARSIKENEKLQSAVDAAVTDYVENELRPEELFVKHSVSEYNKAVNLSRQNADTIIKTMNNGIIAVNNDVDKFNKQEMPTDREILVIENAINNGHHMERYRNAAVEIFRKSLSSDRMQNASRKRWRRNQGWLTRNYINKFIGKEAAFLYEKYLRFKNFIKPGDQNPQKHIAPVTCEFALKTIINGGSVPDIKSRIRNEQTSMDNAVRITAENNAQYNQDVQSENHLPPPTAEPLTLWNTLPERMLQLTNEEKRIFYNPLPDYKPQKDQETFQNKLNQIDTLAFQAVTHRQNDLTQTQESMSHIGNIINIVNDHIAEQARIRKAEADRRAAELAEQTRLEEDRRNKWSRAEYDRLAAIRNEKLKKLRIAIMTKTVNVEYQKQLKDYNDYKDAKDIVDAAYQKWQNFKEAEAKAKETYESKNSLFSFYKYEYNTDYTEINRLKEKYEEYKEKLDELFPTVPTKPDKNIIIQNVKERLGKRQANLLIKDAANLKFEDKDLLISEYDIAAKAAQEYWKKKPNDDPADGKKIQQTQQNNNVADRRTVNTPTIAPPGRNKGKGRGGR